MFGSLRQVFLLMVLLEHKGLRDKQPVVEKNNKSSKKFFHSRFTSLTLNGILVELIISQHSGSSVDWIVLLIFFSIFAWQKSQKIKWKWRVKRDCSSAILDQVFSTPNNLPFLKVRCFLISQPITSSTTIFRMRSKCNAATTGCLASISNRNS